jgi:hypothetical protein
MDKINFEKMFCTTHETGPYNAVIYVMCVCVCVCVCVGWGVCRPPPLILVYDKSITNYIAAV